MFKKIGRSLKSAVKSVGRGIKKAVKTVGKFTNKLGIVGQIGLMIALPAVGSFLAGAVSTGVGAMAASGNSLLVGVSKVLTTAGKFASTVGNAYRTVTDAVMGFVTEVGGGMVNSVSQSLGGGQIFASAPTTVGEGFKSWMGGISENASNITSPFSKAAEQVAEGVTNNYEKSFTDRFEDVLEITRPDGTIDFNADFEIPSVSVINENSPLYSNLPRDTFQTIAEAEATETRGLLGRVLDYSKERVSKLPDMALDNLAATAADIPGRMLQEAAGLGPQAPQYTSHVNVVPEFQTTMPTSIYESNGFSYGATPDNRVQFYAAQNTGYNDFGASGFQSFANLGSL